MLTNSAAVARRGEYLRLELGEGDSAGPRWRSGFVDRDTGEAASLVTARASTR